MGAFVWAFCLGALICTGSFVCALCFFCKLFLRVSACTFWFFRRFAFCSRAVVGRPFVWSPSATRLFRSRNNLFKSLELFRFYRINSELSLSFRNCECHLDYRPPHADVLSPMRTYVGARDVIIISRAPFYIVNEGGAPNTYTNVSFSKNFFCVRVYCVRLSCNAP